MFDRHVAFGPRMRRPLAAIVDERQTLAFRVFEKQRRPAVDLRDVADLDGRLGQPVVPPLQRRFAVNAKAGAGDGVVAALLGGSGTFLGPVIGANVVVTLQEYLSDVVGAWVSVIIGAIFVVCVLVFRRGFVGEIQRLFAQRSSAQ